MTSSNPQENRDLKETDPKVMPLEESLHSSPELVRLGRIESLQGQMWDIRYKPGHSERVNIDFHRTTNDKDGAEFIIGILSRPMCLVLTEYKLTYSGAIIGKREHRFEQDGSIFHPAHMLLHRKESELLPVCDQEVDNLISRVLKRIETGKRRRLPSECEARCLDLKFDPDSSRLTLGIEVMGRRYEVWIGREVALYTFGTLDEGKVELLRQLMPKTLPVVLRHGSRVRNYYVAAEGSILQWCDACNEELKNLGLALPSPTRAKCIDLTYIRGDYENHLPSQLNLSVSIGLETHSLWLGSFFKKALGRLTEKRRKQIEAAMPEDIAVEPKVGGRGKKYYAAKENELKDWLQRIMSY